MPRPIRQEITAVDKTGRAFRSVSSNISKLSRSFGALGAVIGVGSFGLLVKNSLAAADKVQKLSLRIGASTEALSEYRHVAERSGITFEQLTMGWQRMTRRISEASVGMGEARGALRELGVSAQTLNQLRPEEQFEVLADALQKVKNPADQVRLAMKLFDSEGVALVQAMKDGSAGIRELREEAKELGLTLDQETADSAARAADHIARLQSAFEGLGFALIDVLEGPIVAVSNTLVVIAELLRNGAVDAHRLANALGVINGPITEMNALLDMQFKLREKIATLENRPGNIPSGKLTSLYERDERLDRRIEQLRELVQLREDALNADDLFNPIPPEPLNIVISGGTVGPSDEVIKKWSKYGEALENKFKPAAQKAADELAKLQELIDFQQKNNIQIISDDIISEAAFDIMSRFTDATMELDGELSELQKGFSELGPIIGSAFEDAVIAGEQLSDVVDALIKDIARLILRLTITRPLEQGLTQLIGGFDWTSLFSSASPTDISGSFSSGGIATGPTSGYLANLHGTEAVVPLPDGKSIPVDLSGVGRGGVVVNIENNGPPLNVSSTETTVGPDGTQRVRLLVEAEVNRMAGDGRLDRSMRTNYGIARMGAAR